LQTTVRTSQVLMVCYLDQLVDIISYFVDMIGKVRSGGKHIFSVRFALQNQSSQERTYHSPFRNIKVKGFADFPQSSIFRIVEPQHYVMVSLLVSQSFSASFPLFHFRCFSGHNTSQEVDNSKLLRIQLAIRFTDKYNR